MLNACSLAGDKLKSAKIYSYTVGELWDALVLDLKPGMLIQKCLREQSQGFLRPAQIQEEMGGVLQDGQWVRRVAGRGREQSRERGQDLTYVGS